MLINKYSKQERYTVRETAEVYNKVTKPHYLDHVDPSHVGWMHNVLENKKETELCLFENDHFKLQKDYKFNEGDLTTFYALALPKKSVDLKLLSVRDLRGDHVPMLKSVLEESYKAIEKAYGLPSHKLHAYFHYLPTYWLLHVHLEHVDRQGRDAREQVSLESAIFNLEMNSNYYQLCTMNYTVGDKHDLCKALMKQGVLAQYVPPEKDDDWEDEATNTQSETSAAVEKSEA
jgi:m7GpppX diphosphatase